MERLSVGACVKVLSSVLVPLSLLAASPATASEDPKPRITGPHMHQNLSIYFIHGPSKPGPIPLTLDEALATGAATVFETGQVRRLVLQNTSDREVFVQAGDIVKGGRQDRVLTVSLLIPPKAKNVPIGAYCVEQGRWRRRGNESMGNFQSAKNILPLKAAKLAIFAAPIQPALPPPQRVQSGAARPQIQQQRIVSAANRPRLPNLDGGVSDNGRTQTRQQRVWASVGAMQEQLSRNLDARVQSEKSKSSLQLTLENKKLKAARHDLIKALKSKAMASPDIVGYAFAINGRLNSASVYPSNGLFVKMWPRLLEASAIEAIAEMAKTKAVAQPSAGDVTAFLDAARKAPATSTDDLDGRFNRQTREAKNKGVYLATVRRDGFVVHETYIAH
ncbi:MAG TPA: DUF6569 family protein [Hyphomicrobiaceae bacterium]|nr:DUF6569 family protein [Hyphomicrobiaceae bacterium]